MAEVLESVRQVEAIPKGLHWFCPREDDDDSGFYFDEDLLITTGELAQDASITRRVDEAHKRRDLLKDALTIFAFDGTDAEGPQRTLEEGLAEQLSKCDICVREYHRLRDALRQHLLNDYDEDEVKAFITKFDTLNVRRIEERLHNGTATLEKTDPTTRFLGSLDAQGVHAVFEALMCKPFHSDEEELRNHFDHFFMLLQTKKHLKLSNYAPAMTWFVFQKDQTRIQWASREWTRIKRNILPAEFEHVVQDGLLWAISRVQLDCLEKDFLPRFWEGVRLIMRKAEKNVITGCIRALDGRGMEADICRLGYQHMQVDSDAFTSLLGAVDHILQTSPADFWDSLGTISATSWLDEFFRSKALQRLVRQASQERPNDSPTLNALFSWLSPFVESIKPIHRPSAARTVAQQLLTKYQTEEYSSTVNNFCATTASKVLFVTLQGLNAMTPSDMTAKLASEILDLTESHLRIIAPLAKSRSPYTEAASDALGQAIQLDCKQMLASGRSIADQKNGKPPRWALHLPITRQCASSLDYGNMQLAKRLVTALLPLSGSEEFVTKDKELPQAQFDFNMTLRGWSSPVCDILDRIGEFDTEDIKTLFENSETAQGIMALLLNHDNEVRSSALELVKGLSGQSTRREAIGYLLSKHYSTTVSALAFCMAKLDSAKAFGPISVSLKLLPDAIEALCNAQDGILRAATLSKSEKRLTALLWQGLWRLLRVMFNHTEAWSQRGHDRQIMMDFCRDAMDFADKVFDQFGVFRSALVSEDDGDSASTADQMGRQLIALPKLATSDIVRWLRLRDDFLVSRSLALVCKLLIRLRDYEEQVEEKSLGFVMDVVIGASKSTLTPQQKAELSRALEIHAGVAFEEAEVEPEANKKSATERIDLDKWTSEAEKRKRETLAQASPTYEKMKAKKEQEQKEKEKEKQKPSGRIGPRPAVGRGTAPIASDFKKKREQEMAERKRRDAEAMAKRRKQTSSILGEGSGALGLGVQGKEHDEPTKTSDMYVDSSSSEEEDDEMDVALFGSKQPSKKPVKPPGMTKEQAQALEAQRRGPVKKQRATRSRQDMRARLAPDLSPLHSSILSWDYFYDGNLPPGKTPANYNAVLSSFRDAYTYQRTFQPLLELEAWNGFLKAKEENNGRPYEIKVATRSNVDAFLEVSATVSHDDARELGEGDIVLLSRDKSPASSPEDPHCLARVNRMSRKKAHIEVVYRAMPGTSIAPSLAGGSVIYGLKITSIIPLEREYGALLGLQYYDLCDEIAKAKPSPLLKYSDDTLQPHMKNYNVNKAQAKAIKSALDNDAFTLIQGPPGSGKTKTIVALVGALLTESLKAASTAIRQPGAPTNGHAASGGPKKMMVCAPSNAAVDELVMRFKEGVKTTGGEQKRVSVVRLGRSDAINANVQDVTLEELVNRKLNITSNKNGDAHADTQKVMMEHKQVSEELRFIRAEVDEAEAKGDVGKELSDRFAALRRKKAQLSQKVDLAKDQEGQQNRQADINRKRAQQEVLDGADIICATLSGSGHDMFQNLNIEFETVIVDEAAQCVELSCLIPLKYGCSKCVLVGDPKQLPPTVFSKDAAHFKYEQSLFVRMQESHPHDVHLLDTQYRMHPDISSFPSKAFYESRLLDGQNMAALRARPWHGTDILSPFRFFDVQGQQQSAPKGHSLINIAEINIALHLYRRLTSDFRSYDFRGKIGIITPYKSQLRELRDAFKRQYGQSITDDVEFNTTDAFQGRESEVIIFSCVRASPQGGIGFLQDVRRMNVGLTRAMSSLWVLGNSQSLSKGEFWSKLVDHARASQSYTNGDLERMLSKPLKLTKTANGTSAVESKNSHSEERASGADPNEAKPRLQPQANGATSNKPKVAPKGPTIVPKAVPWASAAFPPSHGIKRKAVDDHSMTRPTQPPKVERPSPAAPSSDVDGDIAMSDAPSKPASGASSRRPSAEDISKQVQSNSSSTQSSAKPDSARPAPGTKPPPPPPRPGPPPPKKPEVNLFVKKKPYKRP